MALTKTQHPDEAKINEQYWHSVAFGGILNYDEPLQAEDVFRKIMFPNNEFVPTKESCIKILQSGINANILDDSFSEKLRDLSQKINSMTEEDYDSYMEGSSLLLFVGKQIFCLDNGAAVAKHYKEFPKVFLAYVERSENPIKLFKFIDSAGTTIFQALQGCIKLLDKAFQELIPELKKLTEGNLDNEGFKHKFQHLVSLYRLNKAKQDKESLEKLCKEYEVGIKFLETSIQCKKELQESMEEVKSKALKHLMRNAQVQLVDEADSLRQMSSKLAPAKCDLEALPAIISSLESDENDALIKVEQYEASKKVEACNDPLDAVAETAAAAAMEECPDVSLTGDVDS